MLRGWPALVVMVILLIGFVAAFIHNDPEKMRAFGVSLAVSLVFTSIRILVSRQKG